MAPNDSAEPDSTPPDILDCFWCLIDNCNLNDHSNCGHPQCQRRTRPRMLACFSSPPGEGNEQKPHHQKPQGSHSPSKVIRDSQRVEDLELALKAITRLCDLETKTKAFNQVNEWRVEQLNLMDAEKSLEEDRLWAPTDSYRETMQELLKLHNAERDKWKNDRDKWKLKRDSWKLTCKRLKDEANVLEYQLRKRTMESKLWKAEFTRLSSAGAQGKNVEEVICRDLLEQLHLEQQTLDLQCRTGDGQKASLPQVPTRKLERSSDGMCEHFTQSENDERKEKYNELELEDWVSQQMPLHLILEKQMWANLRKAAVSQGKKIEEVCRDLLKQLEQRNMVIKRIKVDLQKASKWQALAQQQIREQREEIKKLKTAEVAECIVCTNEFGEDPDQHRAYWKNCNHANICYKCTKTLWSSKNRQCPTCKTPASSMPIRLPPKIYL